ncbi:HlyD family type I secretion periplasmic adaptor subunit [Bradyrhizobium sp. dw_411]|uniref:HlyD family type I secretion periplasmic adaptor subunit n=1 Tax=Bradyrhizobium sp. dw_411 TaxID=2720082 RepID=UPI001BCDFFC7|nr:HlyD family type I secretion periplasmic adaptor subunit [Bradyrhizobium sp. dw_411]
MKGDAMLMLGFGNSTAPVRAQRRTALVGYTLIILTFGVMGGWAAVAPLNRGVVAQGVVMIEDNRKVVQHFEGGIVNQILVREGQSVGEGEVLLRLSPVAAGSNLDTIRNQLDSALALEASLTAELAGRDSIVFPQQLLARQDSTPTVARMIEDQTVQFEERKRSRDAQVTLIEAKIKQLETETEGIAVEKSSTEKQIGFLDEELTGLRYLKEKGLIPVTRVLSMEREHTRLEGVVGRAVADTAKAANGMNEARLQVIQLKQKFQEEVSSQLLDTRQKIEAANEKLVVARDMITRLDIKSPRAGTVQGLKVFTVGQVVRAGESLMEVVPSGETLVVHAQLPVNSIEHLSIGQTAEIRFPGLHSRQLQMMSGKLASISHDRLVDDATKQPYFLGLINLSDADLDEHYRDKLVAGMQADVVIATGERTALEYMVSPLADALHRSFRD